MEGWIKVDRKLFNDKAIWANESLIRVYLYLVFNAKIEPEVVYYMGQSIQLNTNELITGRKIIAKNTGVSESTVERNLNWLQSSGLIGQKVNTRYRLVSILYKDSRTEVGRKVDRKWTESEHINKKENNTNKKNDDVDDTVNVDRKYYFDLFKRIEADEIKVELVMKNYFIDRNQFKHLLQQFFRSQEMVHKQWPNLNECLKHFRNWLTKLGDGVRAVVPEQVVDKTDIDDFYNSRMAPIDRNPYQ